MEREVEILSKRFPFSKEQIQNAINYYLTRELTGISEDILEFSPTLVENWENSLECHIDYQGIKLEVKIESEGSKQFWLGVTHVGDSPFSRREHFLGYIEINQIKVSSEIPVDVRIVCGWPPFLSLFQGMADYLQSHLVLVFKGRAEFTYNEMGEFVSWLERYMEIFLNRRGYIASETISNNTNGTSPRLIITKLSIPLPDTKEPESFDLIAKFARFTSLSDGEQIASFKDFENYGSVIQGLVTNQKVILEWDRRFEKFVKELLDELQEFSGFKILFCNPDDLMQSPAQQTTNMNNQIRYKSLPVNKDEFDLKKVSSLLKDIFTETELRNYCLINTSFRPVYEELKDTDRKPEILHRMIAHASYKGLIDELLAWAKEYNLRRYEQDIPYQR